MPRGLDRWPGLGYTGLPMPWKSQGLGLEMTGSLGKGFKQRRETVRLVFPVGHSRLRGVRLLCVAPLLQCWPALGWFVLNGQGICSKQVSFKGPSRLHCSVNHRYAQQLRVITPGQYGLLPCNEGILRQL